MNDLVANIQNEMDIKGNVGRNRIKEEDNIKQFPKMSCGLKFDKVMKEAWPNSERKNHAFHIRKSLDCFIVALSFCGLYKKRKDHNGDDTENTSAQSKKKAMEILSFIYCILVLFLVLLNLIRVVAGIFAGYISQAHSVMLFRTLNIMWMILCNINTFGMLHMSIRNQSLTDTLRHWDKILLKHLELLRLNPDISLFRKTIVGVIIAYAISLCNFVSVSCFVFGKFGNVSHTFGVIISSPFAPTLSVKIIGLFLYLFSIFAWVFPPVLFVLLSKALKSSFQQFNQLLEKRVRESGGKCTGELSLLRTAHLQMCKVVENLDNNFKYLMFGWYISNIPLGCFLLYSMISIEMDPFSLCLFAGWLLIAVVYITVPSVSAALLKDEAHAPLEHIYDIDATDVTLEELCQLNLFLSKLTGTSIGFTPMGLITVSKELLLTLAGVFMTYFFLLLQFKMD